MPITLILFGIGVMGFLLWFLIPRPLAAGSFIDFGFVWRIYHVGIPFVVFSLS
jgi:hypothetical protein